jgi:N-acetylmuramoyl-L-alanine amidase
MPDDKRPQPTDDDEQPKLSPSALFLEMMREAARHADKPDAFEPIESEMESESFTLAGEVAPDELVFSVADEADASDVQLEVDTIDSQFDDDEPIAEPQIELPASKPEKHEPQPAAEARVPIYAPPDTEDTIAPEDRAVLMEAQRIQRIRRRKEQAHRRRVGILGGFFRTMFIAVFAAALASTVFTWFTAPEFITPRVASDLQVADATSIAAVAPFTPTPILVTPNFMQRIGIVSGHRGPENDPGAVCDDGLTEAEINFSVAQMVVTELRSRGYTVDLLDEFDPRLEGYQAAALVSIHANDCRDYGEFVSGFLVARAAARPAGGLDDVLAECIGLQYGRAVTIERRYALTLDMTDYHTFREIHPLTPAAIIELGFLRGDRELLTQRQPEMASGIINGVLCFLNGDNPIPELTATPANGG